MDSFLNRLVHRGTPLGSLLSVISILTDSAILTLTLSGPIERPTFVFSLCQNKLIEDRYKPFFPCQTTCINSLGGGWDGDGGPTEKARRKLNCTWGQILLGNSYSLLTDPVHLRN